VPAVSKRDPTFRTGLLGTLLSANALRISEDLKSSGLLGSLQGTHDIVAAHTRLLESLTGPLQKLKDQADSHRRLMESIAPAQLGWFGATQSLRDLGVDLAKLTGGIGEQLKTLIGQFRGTLFDPEQLARLTAEDRRLVRTMLRRRWIGLDRWLEPLEVTMLLKARSAAAFDAAVCRCFRSRKHRLLNEVVRSWRAVPYLRKRTRTVRQALRAHKAGFFAASIPTLYPLVDGLAAELVPNERGPVRAGPAAKSHHAAAQTLRSETVVTIITEAFYQRYSFDTAKRAPWSANRHAVMHGRVVNYGTEVNSLRVFLLLDTFAYMFRASGTHSERGK
jgi:hypothetical protein